MIEKKGKRHIKPNIGSSLWISKTPLIKNHKNIKKTFFLLSNTMWKYSQLFIIHSNKGKPQHGQPKITFGSAFGAYISNKIPKAILCWLTLLKSTDHIILVRFHLSPSTLISLLSFIFWSCSFSWYSFHLHWFLTTYYTEWNHPVCISCYPRGAATFSNAVITPILYLHDHPHDRTHPQCG